MRTFLTGAGLFALATLVRALPVASVLSSDRVHFQGHPRGSRMGVHPHYHSRAVPIREPYAPGAHRAYSYAQQLPEGRRFPSPDVYGYVAGSCANA